MAAGAHHRLATLGLALLVLALALPPRLLATDRFVTTDELFWVGRSGAFARALATGGLAGTFQSGHPGVTTMWTALLGAGPERVGQFAGARREVSRREVSEHPDFMPTLAAARRGFGVATALGVVLAVLLARRLFGVGPALLGGTLLALDPFLLAHSRLVHIDASLAIWMTVAHLAALVRANGGGPGVLALSGAATALALLAKSPALALLLFVPLALALPRARAGSGWCGTVARDVAAWLAVSASVYVALWPALWVAPLETLGNVLGFVRDNANPDHAAAADGDGAGLLFYPLVLIFRSTPLMLLGLALLLALRPRGSPGRSALVLSVVTLAFGLAMTVAAKGFDRYLLPIFPSLALLAGLGLWRLVERVVPTGRRAFAGRALALVATGLSASHVASAWPYGLTYANPVVGGLPAAHRATASGWGEGLDRVADYLNAKPNAERLKVGVPGEIYTTVLGAQLAGQVGPIERASADPSAWDYVVVYVRNLETGDRPAFLDAAPLRWEPEHTVRLNGVEYAWVYDAANGVPVGATFGEGLTLEGYGLDAVTVRPGQRLDVRLRWRAPAPPPADLSIVLELRSVKEGAPASVVRPLRSADQAAAGASGRFTGRYDLPVEAGLPPGEYRLAVRVVDGAGRPLSLTRAAPRTDGSPADSEAVVLRTIQVLAR